MPEGQALALSLSLSNLSFHNCFAVLRDDGFEKEANFGFLVAEMPPGLTSREGKRLNYTHSLHKWKGAAPQRTREQAS